MKKVIIAGLSMFLMMVFVSSVAFADQWVNGYQRKNGAYVNGYYRSDADGDQSNNWSSEGNYNPYTGQRGYRRY